MLGTNKKGDIKRLSVDKKSYSDHLKDVEFRYEPMLYQKYDIKAKQIAFKYFSDVIDFKINDRLIHGNRQFVVAGAATFDDTLGAHMEVVMREVGPTSVHEVVKRKKLDTVQSSYDPLLEERTEYGKQYVEDEILVLVDAIDLARGHIIQMLDAGKIEQVQYMMTTEITEDIKKEDRFIYNGLEYIVEWIIPQPYQLLVGLNKSKVNYITN